MYSVLNIKLANLLYFVITYFRTEFPRVFDALHQYLYLYHQTALFSRHIWNYNVHTCKNDFFCKIRFIIANTYPMQVIARCCTDRDIRTYVYK